MTGLAELLTAVWEAITSLVAPYEIISEWEQGAKTRTGRIIKTCRHTNGLFGSGLHFYWPLLGTIHTHVCNTSTTASDQQTLTTKDGETVVVSMTIAWRIADVAKFYRWIHEQDETIENVLECAIGRAVPTLDWWASEEQENWGLVENLVSDVEKEVKRRLRKWGVELTDIAANTMVKCRTYRLITD